MSTHEEPPSSNQLPDDIPYERWIQYVFDHPVLEEAWWWAIDSEWWDDGANPARTLSYLTRLFRNGGEITACYSIEQIDRGLNFIFSSSCSNHMFVFMDGTLPLLDRVAGIRSLENLYRDLMAPTFLDQIAHGANGNSPNNHNFICYMLWDVCPVYKGNCPPEICQAVMDVFKRVLNLKSEACLESVLHGLGHWHLYFPKEVKEIVESFLKNRKDISRALRQYATYAAVGNVQ